MGERCVGVFECAGGGTSFGRCMVLALRSLNLSKKLYLCIYIYVSISVYLYLCIYTSMYLYPHISM